MRGDPTNEASRQVSRRRWPFVVSAILVVAMVGFLLWVRSTIIVDRPRPELRVVNQTNQTVFIFIRLRDGSDKRLTLASPIPPHSTGQAGTCGAAHLVARDRDGTFISGRGPFPECNLEDWIIQPRTDRSP
jgi:hypothetical protein